MAAPVDPYYTPAHWDWLQRQGTGGPAGPSGYTGLPSGLIAPADPFDITGTQVFVANSARMVRATARKTGTLVQLAAWIGNVTGNWDIGIWSTAATRTLLWSRGTFTPAGTNWQILGGASPPSVAVTAGDELIFGMTNDGTTGNVGRADVTTSGVNATPSEIWDGTAGGTIVRAGTIAAAPPFSTSLPTFAAGAIAQSGARLVICGWIA